MILSTLLRPPAAPPEPPPGAVTPRRRTLTVGRERARRYTRNVAIGIALSVLFHVVLVLLSPLVVRYMEPGSVFFRNPVVPRARDDGMRVVEIRVAETVPAEPLPEQPQPEPEEEPAAGEPEGATASTLSAAEQLRPRVGDWRLWVVSPETGRADESPAERAAAVNDRLHAILEAYEDSIAAMLAEERMDWTVGKEGNRWGVSPGKLHLGPVTLPLPLYLGPHPATQRELGERTQEWYLIRGQQDRGAIDEEFGDRVKAIRERKAQEKAKKDSTKG